MAHGNHEVIDARIRHAEQTAAARPRRASWLRRCLATVHLWQQRAQERRALAALDDRLLADIGLTRADAQRECVQPFWRPAPSEQDLSGC